MESHDHAAEYLYALRNKRATVSGIPGHMRPMAFPEAYSIQNKLVHLLLSEQHGAEAIGYKVACTNLAIQEMFGLTAPVFGRLLDNCCFSSPARVPGNLLVTRCIEAEFGFLMSDDVPASSEPYTPQSIAEYVAAVIPAIEIVETHYTSWTTAGALQMVADNALHGAWIVGTPITSWRNFDLATHPVRLLVDGIVTREGSGGNVLGNPLHVLCWLAQELPRYGNVLRRGDYVTTGLTTDIYFSQPGEVLCADFGELGEVSCVIV